MGYAWWPWRVVLARIIRCSCEEACHHLFWLAPSLSSSAWWFHRREPFIDPFNLIVHGLLRKGRLVLLEELHLPCITSL
ncbi:hypothetical protein DL93DRAFT_2074487 [Clavulina sp. PMI_390]|nr:hypothetical protein DL93DRAFT_2074487 [Clavulina sp. PMI_390]